MKKFLASLGILSLALALAAPVWAADVTATVTPQVISISVTDGSVDYGVLATSDTNNTFDGAAIADTQTIENTGNDSVDIALRSSDAADAGAAGVTDWALEGTAASEVFVHSYDIDASVSAVWTVFPFDGAFANTNTADVATLASNGDMATLDLKIDMPTSAADVTLHSIDVTVIATAS